MSPTTLPGAGAACGLQGRHVLIATLAFFGVVFAVNGLLLYKALATHSGLVAQEPYRKGLAYNDRIAADERQAALRWTAEVSVSAPGDIALTLAAADGRPVAGLSIAAMLGRPTSNRHDLRLSLVEVEPGRYVAAAAAIDAGAWLLDIEAREGTGPGAPVYRMRRRVWVKP